MRKNKLKLNDLKTGMLVTYIADLKNQIEILVGRIEMIEDWNIPGLKRIVLNVGPSEDPAYETIMAKESDDVIFVVGVV